MLRKGFINPILKRTIVRIASLHIRRIRRHTGADEDIIGKSHHVTFLLGPVLLLTAHSPDPHLQPEEILHGCNEKRFTVFAAEAYVGGPGSID